MSPERRILRELLTEPWGLVRLREGREGPELFVQTTIQLQVTDLLVLADLLED